MPAAHTKHPDGRPMLEPGALRALWLEEGDGVVILEYGGLLAVLPGWSDMAKGLPGYCRDVIGQTPFGWSLDDAMEGLGPRAAQAEDFWRWRADKGAWARLPAGGARPSAGQARPGGQVLGRGRRQAAAGRRLRAAAHRAAARTRSCPRSG